MQVQRAFRANVLNYGRLWLRRPRLWAFRSPSLFWAFVAPSSSSMGVWVFVAPFRRSGITFSSMGVGGSVVIVYGRLGLRRSLLHCSGLMHVRRAFRGNVLIYGRLLLRRSRSWGFVPPLTVGDFAFCSLLLLVYMLFGFGEKSPR